MSKSFSKFSKIALTCVSAMSLIIALNDSVIAAVGTNETTTASGDITDAIFTPNANFTAGDNLIFGGNHTITISAPGFPAINSVNFNNKQGSILTITDNESINLLTNFLSTGGAAGNIVINNNNTVTFEGSFSDIKGVTINSGSKGRFALDTMAMNIDGQGALVIRSDNDKYINSDIGSATTKLNTITPTVVFNGEGINIRTTKTTLQSGKSIYANEFKLYGENEINNNYLDSSIFVIEDNGFIDALITTTPFTPGEFSGLGLGVSSSEVEVNGSATIVQDIGTSTNKMNNIKFLGSADNSNVYLSGDLYSDYITSYQTNLILTQDSVFSVAESYIANNSIHSLGLNSLTIQKNGNIRPRLFVEGPFEILPSIGYMSETIVFNISANDTKAGNVIIDGGSFTIGGGEGGGSMNLHLIDLTTTIPYDPRSYSVFGTVINDGSIVFPDDSNVGFDVDADRGSPRNGFTQWSYSDGVITQRVVPYFRELLVTLSIKQLENPGPADLTNIRNIANSNSGVRNDLVRAVIEDDGGVQQFINGLNPALAEISENTFDAVQDLVGDVSAHLNQNSGAKESLLFTEDNNSTGLSAGDQVNKYGIWTNYSMSVNSQKAKGNSPGYKSRNNGVTIGFDTLINDDMTIGIAFGYIDTKVNHKDSNFGDKTNAKSSLVSIYSITELLNNWYVQGQGILGQTKINNKESRNTKANPETAKADYKVSMYGLSLETGYHFSTKENFVVTPLVGLELGVIGKTRYQEYGTTNQNLLVKKGVDTKLIGSMGVAVAKNYNISGYNITPEVYGVIRHNLLNKTPAIDAKLENVEQLMVVRSARNTRTFYNLGLGITHAMKTSQVTLGYDCYLGEKYLSHQGSIKLRLDF
jgi:outer membrane autotransporter protein